MKTIQQLGKEKLVAQRAVIEAQHTYGFNSDEHKKAKAASQEAHNEWLNAVRNQEQS